jgi:hypothetical protein
MLCREVIYVYSENHKKPINTFCEQNAELLNVNVGGTYRVTLGFEGIIFHCFSFLILQVDSLYEKNCENIEIIHVSLHW